MVRLLAVVAAALLVACASSEQRSPDAAPDAAEVDGSEADAADAAGPDATDAAVDALDAAGGPDACVATTEVCNGLDDNCNTVIDEGFPTLGATCMVGVGGCGRSGQVVCAATGAGVECDAVAGPPATETCNNADDDCDGNVDENFGLGAACDGPDGDLCAEGMTICNTTGGTTCSDTTGERPETCNNLDDDCDTRIDEGFNLGATCDGADTDSCLEGTLMCNAAGAAVCSDLTSSTVELCNGLDDDCRNGVDDGFAVNVACMSGVGACARPGTFQCNGAGTGVQCNAVAAAPVAEICGDGIDQDCNGTDITCPINDRPAGALNISAGGTFTVDLSAANNDQDFTGTSCGMAGGRDVYYTFTLPAAETVYVDTFGSNFDSTLRVFAGSCTALGALQSCFDDACALLQTQGALSLAAGTYCVVADQFSSFQSDGALVLNFTRAGRTGTALPATSGTVAGTSCSGTNASTGSCQSNSTAQDAAYYFMVCPSASRTVTASTCTGTSFDSVVYLRQGRVTSPDLACSDDATGCGSGLQSNITGGTAIGPGIFWLTVDGYQTSCGAFTLTYSVN